ncbi:hypothetical protein [Streptomyces sp. NPDC059224]|uniref:hypothetical protein n=1 Tax=Streptomyces sp. NPDC059224 TaxID=3346775 RepID=UPI00368E7E9E
MTDATTGNDRQSMSGDIYPGDEAMPGREERTATRTTGATADRGDTSARGATPGRESVAAERTGEREEAPGQAVLVAGNGPGHSPDAARDDRSARTAGRPVTRDDRAGASDGRLMPNEECGQLEERLQHALTGFVDEPRAAVEEADRAVEELSARFTDAVDRRRRTLRGSWQETDRDHPGTTDTEQLRLALREYRELADRLLHI